MPFRPSGQAVAGRPETAGLTRTLLRLLPLGRAVDIKLLIGRGGQPVYLEYFAAGERA